MLASIKELFSLLSIKQRKQFYTLQVLVIVMSFTEMVGIASIGPFMALISDISILDGNNILADSYQSLGFTDPYEFVFFVGVSVLVILTIGTIFSIFTVWKLVFFCNQIGKDIKCRLFAHYMHQPWLFHAGGNSTVLRTRIQSEAERVTIFIIQPLMALNSKIILVLFISSGIFLFNPMVAVIGMSIFGGLYYLIFRLVRLQQTVNGITASKMAAQLSKLLSEGLGGIKDTLLLGHQSNFINRFQNDSESWAKSRTSSQTLIQVPRYFMELISFSSIIFLTLYLVKSSGGEIRTILPSLAIYALAGIKLLPAFQQIYANLSLIRTGLPAYEAIKEDLKNSQIKSQPLAKDSKFIRPSQSISLRNITFTYPNKDNPTLTNLNIEIPVNTTVGIVGATGSGKSTTIDLILGLIFPSTGQILVDNKPINQKNLRAWQNTLGFVPQNIFLSDTTIKENIAFGLSAEEINNSRVKKVGELAHLDELISELPEGYNTRVGERGVQLSGGQRQRIGIARALYNDANILILDEATSALDGITEKIIMDAVHDFSGNKTIIMIAHRFTTVKQCDFIYFMDKGKIIDQGTYADLLIRNAQFKKMANHS